MASRIGRPNPAKLAIDAADSYSDRLVPTFAR
jgi:hypothetical protein